MEMSSFFHSTSTDDKTAEIIPVALINLDEKKPEAKASIALRGDVCSQIVLHRCTLFAEHRVQVCAPLKANYLDIPNAE